MTNNLEAAKKRLQLKKMNVAKDEYEVKIMEKEEQILHLKEEIEKQDIAIKKLMDELGE